MCSANLLDFPNRNLLVWHSSVSESTHTDSLTQNTNRLRNWIREVKEVVKNVGRSNEKFKKRTQQKPNIESMASEPHNRNCHGAQLSSISKIVQFTCSCFSLSLSPSLSLESTQSMVITSIFGGGNRRSVSLPPSLCVWVGGCMYYTTNVKSSR